MGGLHFCPAARTRVTHPQARGHQRSLPGPSLTSSALSPLISTEERRLARMTTAHKTLITLKSCPSKMCSPKS